MAMVKTSHLREFNNLPHLRWLNGPRLRGIFVEAWVRRDRADSHSTRQMLPCCAESTALCSYHGSLLGYFGRLGREVTPVKID
jgi:hypothetical protein